MKTLQKTKRESGIVDLVAPFLEEVRVHALRENERDKFVAYSIDKSEAFILKDRKGDGFLDVYSPDGERVGAVMYNDVNRVGNWQMLDLIIHGNLPRYNSNQINRNMKGGK